MHAYIQTNEEIDVSQTKGETSIVYNQQTDGKKIGQHFKKRVKTLERKSSNKKGYYNVCV